MADRVTRERVHWVEVVAQLTRTLLQLRMRAGG